MTKRKHNVPRPTAELLTQVRVNQNAEGNRWVREWLSDDEDRSQLYRLINQTGGVLEIPSRDVAPPECGCDGLAKPRTPPDPGHTRKLRLVTERSQIVRILVDDGRQYSNRTYAELGGGSFMLALDPMRAVAHQAQRDAYRHCFPHDPALIGQISQAACQAASILSLRASEFDLAIFSEQCALRFCQMLLGYASTDFRLLETTLRAAYGGLVYQVMGRHFVNEPLAVPAAKQALGQLLTRTSALIDAYAVEDEDGLKGCDDPTAPASLARVLEQLATYGGNLNGEQRAIMAVGAAVGTVGNVQAAACIAVEALFKDPDLFHAAHQLMRCKLDALVRVARWKGLIQSALAKNPPIPFVPRLAVTKDGMAVGDSCELLLALGGGTQGIDATADEDPLIWGLAGHMPQHCAAARAGQAQAIGTHWCIGNALAWPLIVEIVSRVMALPGLAQGLDPEDASVVGLKKRWGFACERYPLTHQRERRVHQSSLNVAMRLKSPAREYADRAREVIRSGAPRIEEALRTSRHVHFAWFELIEGDTVLVLHTVYDGPITAYIQHFALKVGEIFDALFACTETPPPMPVDKFPNEFVAHIQRYDRAPAMGYFFSAYPGADVANILRDDWARP